jgi:uroporphyrin-III C-methyltransferase / precorrin-2 dehydrogenase / sirohydrochlorin ferrochelatase
MGMVYFVGAGPGDPELLTVRAHRLLQHADVVLHDDLVPSAIVSMAGERAEVVNVGKRCGAKRRTQEEINTQMIESARRGLEVVRLKSGDPGIFGRLAEELDALETAHVPFEVIPGITAGLAAAASLGVSLTDRRTSSRVVIVTGHPATGSPELQKTDWKGLARKDATLVVYMPGRDLSGLRQELLVAGLPGNLPAVLVSRATTIDQQYHHTTLAQLSDAPLLEAPAILLIGWPLERGAERARAANIFLALECANLIPSA